MISQRYEVLCPERRRARPHRRAVRRYQPALDSVLQLEPRALLHGGSVLAHASAVVRAAASPPVDPTAELQQALAISYATAPGSVETVQTHDATILVPTGLAPGHTYPLVVAFAYNGDPHVPFERWRTLSAQDSWIVYASKDFQNSVLHGGLGPSESVASRVKQQVDGLSPTLPVDRSRIIFTGYSGGANFADFMNLRYPGYAAGVIINSGQIPAQLFSKTPRPGFLTFPSASDFAGARDVGVFLASPADGQFYGITQANSHLMQKLGWNTIFLSFPGGHVNAPLSTYDQAIAWITSQPSWTANP